MTDEERRQHERRRKLPYMQFFPHDWLYDTRILTDQEKGVLIDLLCFMWNQPERGILTGHPEDLGRMVGKEWHPFSLIIESLYRKKVIDQTESNGVLTLISRRMVREEKDRESGRLRQRKYYQKSSKHQTKQNLTEEKSYIRSHIKEIHKEKPSSNTPTLEEVVAYCKERKSSVDPIAFFNHYEAAGWMRGKTKITRWRAAVAVWEQNQKKSNGETRREALVL